jgi:hypothetical protein
MRCLPRSHARRVLGVAKVVPVRRLAHPAPLARRLARSPAWFLCTVTLALPNAGIGHEKPFAMRALTLTGRMHGAGHSRRPASPRQTHRRTLHSVHEGRKSTRTGEDVSYGITKKILGKNREFQTAERRWVSDRCWQPLSVVSFSWAGLLDFACFLPCFEATDPPRCLAQRVALALHFLSNLSHKTLIVCSTVPSFSLPKAGAILSF